MLPMPPDCCMAETIIETTRLRLRTWDAADVAPFMAALNTPAVMEHLGGLGDAALYQSLYKRMTACQTAHGHCFWIVERKADGELLGFCGLYRTEKPGTPVAGLTEIGWRLKEDAWGHGYAREAAEASLTYGFGHLGFPRIYAYTIRANAASWGLMLRLGMVRVADLDYTEHYKEQTFDTIVYAIDKKDWMQ